jgi:hypothetical protein
MRQRISIIVFVFLFAGLNGQTVTPSISFEKVVHDFGKIKEEGGTVQYDFEFVNTGGSPLLISNVRATCGCTAPSWTREPVPPGGKGFVRAIFNPAGRPSAFTKYLYVTSNSEPSVVRLTITGEVLAKPLSIEDEYRYSMGGLRLKASHLPFGNVTNTGKKNYQMEVINTSDKPISLGFSQVPGHVDIQFDPKVLQPMEKGVIKATYDASKRNDWGMVIDRVNVMVDGKLDRSYRLVISANIVEDFSALSPEQLAKAPKASMDDTEVNFGKLTQNERFEHAFVLTNTGKSTLYIRKIKASCGCTAVQPEKKQVEPGESVQIKTVFNPAGKRGNQNKNVTIITNDPNRSNIILRIRGEVVTS